MPAPEGRTDRSTAWDHFQRTGTILPHSQSEIAGRLADRTAETTEEEAVTDDRRIQV